MRRLLLPALGAALATAGAARAQTSPILPGYWDSTQAYSVLLSGGGRSRKCLTAQEVAQFIEAPETSHYQCRYASHVVGGGRAQFGGGSCYNRHGRRVLSHVQVAGRYAPEAFHLDFRFDLEVSAGVGLPGTASIDAHRISAQCPQADPAAPPQALSAPAPAPAPQP